MMSTDARPTRSRTGRNIALVVTALMLVPISLAFVIIPLLQGMPFDSPAELTTENIESLRVHLLNREDLDGGPDVGPYYAAPEDYERLLAPLKAAAEVTEYPDARGPFLGEYRVVLKSGRKGTILLYWVGTMGDPRTVTAYGSVAGSAGMIDAAAAGQLPPVRFRFQVGEHKFEGVAATAVIRVVEECAKRGK